MEKYQNVIFVGDHHGDWNLFMRQFHRIDLHDCVIISVGDNGEGMRKAGKDKESIVAHKRLYEKLNEDFKEYNVKFYSVRGNHTDSYYYTGENRVVLSNFEFLEDYTYKEINGESYLFVGGAISVDRVDRWKNVDWVDYWEDEVFILDESKTKEADILVTHTGPSWIGPGTKHPFIKRLAEDDPELISDLLDERSKMDKLFELVKPKKWYIGHFHRSEINTFEGCSARILDILEFFEHRT